MKLSEEITKILKEANDNYFKKTGKLRTLGGLSKDKRLK